MNTLAQLSFILLCAVAFGGELQWNPVNALTPVPAVTSRNEPLFHF